MILLTKKDITTNNNSKLKINLIIFMLLLFQIYIIFCIRLLIKIRWKLMVKQTVSTQHRHRRFPKPSRESVFLSFGSWNLMNSYSQVIISTSTISPSAVITSAQVVHAIRSLPWVCRCQRVLAWFYDGPGIAK